MKIFVERQICSSATNLEHKMVSAWIYIDGVDIVPTKSDRGESHCNFSWEDGGDRVFSGVAQGAASLLQQRQWLRFSWQFNQPTNTRKFRVRCYLIPRTGGAWIGTVYFDDIRFE